jgi:hypothetical protein
MGFSPKMMSYFVGILFFVFVLLFVFSMMSSSQESFYGSCPLVPQAVDANNVTPLGCYATESECVNACGKGDGKGGSSAALSKGCCINGTPYSCWSGANFKKSNIVCASGYGVGQPARSVGAWVVGY